MSTTNQSGKSSGRSALIAEDSRIQAMVLKNRLTEAGFEVRVAEDGAVAVQMARQSKPDVIISDIEMPRMNGYEFCREVKQDPTLCDVPVMLLSTLSDPVDIIRGLDAGADNYMTKPYDSAFLLSRVESLLQTPVNEAGQSDELSVTLAGQTFHVKSGRRQVLNLLVSTFENAVEKNRELHKANEQLTLAKQKLELWNAELEALNGKLDVANRRMSNDLQAAARVQRSLLPAGSISTPGVSFSWKYTPCDELAGDFLNYFPLDDRHLAMFVVDVSGHGAASALLAVAIGRVLSPQVSASSLLMQPDPKSSKLRITPPSEVARELNRRFQMDSQNGLYFTMVYGVLDLQTREMRFVAAGHPPMVYLPRGGQPRFIEGSGFAIGMIDDTEFDEQVIKLQPGDRAYYYSDGVPEAMDEKLNQFSNERMLSILSQQSAQPLSNSVDSLFESVRTWCTPHGPKDDVSILGWEMLPSFS